MQYVTGFWRADQTVTLGHDTVGKMSRPRRQAAERGRYKVKNWIKQLGGPPEDVTD